MTAALSASEGKEKPMRIGLFSDVHLTRKPYRLVRALQWLEAADILLIVGGIADRGTPEQFALAESILNPSA